MSAALSIAVISLLSVAATERADITDPDVRTAIQAYDALSFSNVVPLLKRALSRPELSQADRRAALAYIGRTYAIFKDPKSSEAAFRELLGLDPSFAPSPAESPLIREAHANAVAQHLAAGGTLPNSARAVTTDTGAAAVQATTPPVAEERPFDRRWIYGGAGAAALVVILLVWRPWRADHAEGNLGTWELP